VIIHQLSAGKNLFLKFNHTCADLLEIRHQLPHNREAMHVPTIYEVETVLEDKGESDVKYEEPAK